MYAWNEYYTCAEGVGAVHIIYHYHAWGHYIKNQGLADNYYMRGMNCQTYFSWIWHVIWRVPYSYMAGLSQLPELVFQCLPYEVV